MRSRHLRYLSQQLAITNNPPATSVQAADPHPPVRGSRKQRRRAEVFNRRLARRLSKDDTPAKVEMLPDGSIHVTVSKPKDE